MEQIMDSVSVKFKKKKTNTNGSTFTLKKGNIQLIRNHSGGYFVYALLQLYTFINNLHTFSKGIITNSTNRKPKLLLEVVLPKNNCWKHHAHSPFAYLDPNLRWLCRYR